MMRLAFRKQLVSLSVAAATSALGASVPLSSLDLKPMTCGWSEPKGNEAIGGGPLSIAGRSFATGISTVANSKLRVDLSNKARRFTAQVGVNDNASVQGSVEFIVIGDSKELWRSGVMKVGQPAKSVDENLTGVRVLTLRVTDGGDGEGDDYANWADAQIVMVDDTKPVSIPAYETLALQTKSFSLNFQVGDDGRLYQRAIGGSPSAKLPRNDEAFPQWGDGYNWEPALQVVHADGNTSTTLLYEGSNRTTEGDGREVVRISLYDPAYPFNVTLAFRTYRDENVIEQWTEIQHRERGIVKLEQMASSALLLVTNVHLLHFFGDWSKEMQPCVEPLTPGTKVLDSKIGVRAHQFRNPSFVLSFDGPPQEDSGRVLAGSLAWSGNFRFAFDNFATGLRALCGVNSFASTYHLKAGDKFTTPTMIWTWSDQGLGGMSRKLHRWAREFALREGNQPRSVLLNNWEATGFDFDFDRIVSLYDPAKEIGSELFLLDDGWFANKYPRLGDNAGLGDWDPNKKRFPKGLAPLATEANKRGMKFGIWIEPEMVNPKSELFERHPNWIIRQPKRELELQRNQLVLDLTRPEVQRFEWRVIQDMLSVPGINYAKWDCNRYLTQPGSTWLSAERQSHLWIDYTRALYDLMAKTAKAFPKTELMLCSGGGGRVDYGALQYFHEFWPSDSTDPIVRLPMLWDYSYFFPAMSMATHVTHSGNRPMHFACSVAMSARYGMDLDLVKLPPQDKAVCAGAITAYKRIREIVHLGDLYRLERPHGAERGAVNYVSADKTKAVLFVFQLKDGSVQPVHPQGLDPVKHYTVREMNPAPGRAALVQEGKSFTGEQLMRAGIVPNCVKGLEACVVELAP